MRLSVCLSLRVRVCVCVCACVCLTRGIYFTVFPRVFSVGKCNNALWEGVNDLRVFPRGFCPNSAITALWGWGYSP